MHKINILSFIVLCGLLSGFAVAGTSGRVYYYNSPNNSDWNNRTSGRVYYYSSPQSNSDWDNQYYNRYNNYPNYDYYNRSSSSYSTYYYSSPNNYGYTYYYQGPYRGGNNNYYQYQNRPHYYNRTHGGSYYRAYPHR